MGNIVSVANKRQGQSLEIALVFCQRLKICKCLARVLAIAQAIDDGN